MASLTCICGYYMNNNMDIVDFEYDCLSDKLFHETVEIVKNGVDKYFIFPEKIPDIWRCPKCKTIIWFEYLYDKDRLNKRGMLFLPKHSFLLKEYRLLYSCPCGYRFNDSYLFHCYSFQQSAEMMDKIDEAVERNLPAEFEDSTVHIWKCPNCNRLYWIDCDSGIVERYERRAQ